MPFISITSGLTIKVPTRGTTNWDETLRTDTFNKISSHDHSGSGNGTPLGTAAISADAITGAKIRLDNDEYLRARNAANSADLSLIKADSNDEIIFGTTVGTIELQDDGLTIVDNADNTKKIAIDASAITTATTRTLSAPDATGTIVLNDNTATLTGKTITMPSATGNRALETNGSGTITESSITSTELGYLSGVTSAIQTQLGTKITDPMTTNGDIIYENSGPQRLPIGSAGEVLTVSGGLPAWGANTITPIAPTSKTTTYTATTSDEVILADTSGGAWTLTLYAASGNAGRRLKIIKTTSDTAALTIDGNSAETINGNTTTTVNTQYETLVLYCDGSNWLIEDRKSNTKWNSFTITASSGFGTLTNNSGFWRRVGDTMQIKGSFTMGTTTAADASIGLPSGYDLDTSKFPAGNRNIVGRYIVMDGTDVFYGNVNKLVLFYDGTDTDSFYMSQRSASDTTMDKLTTNAAYNAGESVAFDMEVPISGWKGDDE